MGSAAFATVQRSKMWGILLVFLSLQPLLGQSLAPNPKLDSLDPALKSIVKLLIDQPQVDEVVDRAWQWALNRQRSDDLLQALLVEARQGRSDRLFHCCAKLALKGSDPYQAIQILEEGSLLPDSKECPHALARIWLRGGWVEAAQTIRQQQGVDPLTDFILRLHSGALTAPDELPIVTAKDREFAIEVFPRLELSQKGSLLLEKTGDLSASLSILIRAGDLPGINRLLSIKPQLVDQLASNEALPLARLTGKLGNLRQLSPSLLALWKSSMGESPAGSSLLFEPQSGLAMTRLIQQLGAACTQQNTLLARKIWICIERLTAPMKPLPMLDSTWEQSLGAAIPDWVRPQKVAERMGDETLPRAAQLCRRSSLFCLPGSSVEARLWFHAGRLSGSVVELQRALRIFPEGKFRRPTDSPGISVTSSLSEAVLPIPNPRPLAIVPPKDAVIGELAEKLLRLPQKNRSSEIWYLHDWKILGNETREGEVAFRNLTSRNSDVPLKISLEAPDQNFLKVSGTDRQWSIQISNGKNWIMQSSKGSSLFDSSGLPRIDLLQEIFGPCPDHLTTQPAWENWPQSVIDFAHACGQYLRFPHWQNHVRLEGDDENIRVTLGPLSGDFRRTPRSESWNPESSAKLIPPRQRFPSLIPSPGPTPQTVVQLSGTAVLEQEWKIDQNIEGLSFDPPLLFPAGEKQLSTTGTEDRLAITRSGNLGWFPSGWIATPYWLPLLDPPLNGPLGLPPLPVETHPAKDPWATAITPRVRETKCSDGSVFLVVGNPLLQVDSRGVRPTPLPKNYPGHCKSAQLLTNEGRIPNTPYEPLFPWYLDSEQHSLYGPDFQQPLPAKGAYALHGHPQGPLVLGQDRGEAWLAIWKENDWRFLNLPALPGERDRRQLRAAAITVVGSQILLVANSLWILGPDQPPQEVIPPHDPGAYRAVRWVQPPPLVRGNRVSIQRPWGVQQVWKFADE